MSKQSRALVVVCLVVLVIGAAAITLIEAPGADAPSARPARAESGVAHAHSGRHSERAGVAVLEPLSRDAYRAANVATARATRRVVGDPREESEQVPNQELRTYATEARDAHAVARRFLAAFFDYELGELTPWAERELRATTTASFARELAGATPRVPPGAQAPTRARLAVLEFAPGVSRRGRLVSAGVVAVVARGAERTRVAISLRRVGDAWLVNALGR